MRISSVGTEQKREVPGPCTFFLPVRDATIGLWDLAGVQSRRHSRCCTSRREWACPLRPTGHQLLFLVAHHPRATGRVEVHNV